MLTIDTTDSVFINVGIRRLERLTTASLRNEESNLIYDCSYYQVISLYPFTTMDSQTVFQIYSINQYAIRSFIFVCLSLTVSKCSILPTELHPVKCVNFMKRYTNWGGCATPTHTPLFTRLLAVFKTAALAIRLNPPKSQNRNIQFRSLYYLSRFHLTFNRNYHKFSGT